MMKLLLAAIVTVITTHYSNAKTIHPWCNFESDLCGYVSNMFTDNNGILRSSFSRRKGTTPSGGEPARYTGPSKAQEGEYYVYFEASHRPPNELSGTFTSPAITRGNYTNYRVDFYYFDFGQELGPLRLKVLNSAGALVENIEVNDGNSPTKVWNFTSIVIKPPKGETFKIQFEATTDGGYTSDWAIDNMKIEADVPANCGNTPCHASATCTEKTEGGYTCTCLPGYTGDGTKTGTGCTDVIECNSNPCDANANCANTVGSYTCTCKPGFSPKSGTSGVSVVCETDVSKCVSMQPCHSLATCANTNVGVGYSCTCMVGYSGDGLKSGTGCSAGENECLRNPCHVNAICANTIGSYTCTCKTGYVAQAGTSGTSVVCVVPNFCSSVTCPTNSVCSNTATSYECNCKAGYKQGGTKLNTACYLNGGLSEWKDSTTCNKSCGGGMKTQTRSCTNPVPHPQGEPCDPQAKLSQTVQCNVNTCPVGCQFNKPCECQTSVTQYMTGKEPNMTLLHFTGVLPGDLTTALNYLSLWTKKIVDDICKNAKCNTTVLEGAINNLNNNLKILINIDSSLKTAQAHMRSVIDCNQNQEIDDNLWTVYDFLCERSIAINQVKIDLMSKKNMLDAEKERCEKRSWITSLLEPWFKKY